MGHKVKRLLA